VHDLLLACYNYHLNKKVVFKGGDKNYSAFIKNTFFWLLALGSTAYFSIKYAVLILHLM
jgi:hypothetical protein